MNALDIAKLLEVAAELAQITNKILTETEKNNPQVWNEIKGNYQASIDQWNESGMNKS